MTAPDRESDLLDRMRTHLSTPGAAPTYVRLQEAVQGALSAGALRPGDALPTVRAVASALKLAPNTVAKAYAALARQGLTENRAGAGTSVAAGAWAGQLGQQEALQAFRTLVQELRVAGLKLDDARGVLDELEGEPENVSILSV